MLSAQNMGVCLYAFGVGAVRMGACVCVTHARVPFWIGLSVVLGVFVLSVPLFIIPACAMWPCVCLCL